MVTPDQRLIAWLLQDRRRYQDRSGPPTLDDIRACGVERRHILAYLRRAGWSCEAPDVGDSRPLPWSAGPAPWTCPIYPTGLDVRHDDRTITALGQIENRSPWAVLDDIAHMVGPRTVYLPDDQQPAAIVWGSSVCPHPGIDKPPTRG